MGTVGPYNVHKHRMRDRKKKGWTTSTKLKPGMNIVRTFKDNVYTILVQGPRFVDNPLSKAIKVDKLAIIEVLSDRKPKVALIMEDGRGYVGTVERVEFEQKGLILKRTIPKVTLRSLGERIAVNYTDMREVYVQPSRDIWGTLVKYKTDDYHYEVYLVSVEGEYNFRVTRG